MSEFIGRREHDEFSQRMEAEHERQNARLRALEEKTTQIDKLIVSVEKMAVNMQSMVTELKKQGERLEKLESRDGEMWRKIAGHVITTAIGIFIGYLFKQIGM